MIRAIQAIDALRPPCPQTRCAQQDACELQFRLVLRTLASGRSAFRRQFIGNSSCTGLPLGGLATSCLIGKPLALYALERAFGAARIVYAKLFPVIISEIKLGKIPPQVFFGDVLINAVYAAFEDAEKAFNRIRVDDPTRVFFLLMLDGAVRCEVMADARINHVLVAHEIAFAFDVAGHKAAQSVCRNRGDMKRPDLAVAFDQRKYRHFIGWRKECFARRLSAHVGFVHFDRHASAAKAIREDTAIVSHGFANAMAEEPGSFHAAPKHPLNLSGRDALLAGAEQVNDLKPQVQRQVTILEDRPDPHREGLLAGVAFEQSRTGRLAVQAANTGSFATARAYRAVRPQVSLNVGESGGFTLEMGFIQNGLGHGHRSYGRNTTSWVRYVKCNVALARAKEQI